MNLFVDTISSPAYLVLFDKNRKIVNQYSWDIKGKESSTLIPKLDEFLKSSKLEYGDLENIVVVNGPGSFTGVRTTVLVMNTINYIIKKNLIAVSYFDLFHDYPIIKSSSKGDCFIQFDESSRIEIVKNENILKVCEERKIVTLFGEVNKDIFEGIKIVDKVDYDYIIKEIDLNNVPQELRIVPLYIKKPNIS